jgi:hypothetical protein
MLTSAVCDLFLVMFTHTVRCTLKSLGLVSRFPYQFVIFWTIWLMSASCRCSFQVGKAPQKMALWCLLLISPASSESSGIHVPIFHVICFFQKALGPMEFAVLRHDDLIHPFRRYCCPYYCWHPCYNWRTCSYWHSCCSRRQYYCWLSC